MFVGTAGGETYFYLNSGTVDKANFYSHTPSDSLYNIPTSNDPMEFLYTGGVHASPAFADLDNDGDLDGFIGDNNGLILYYENTESRKHLSGSIVDSDIFEHQQYILAVY